MFVVGHLGAEWQYPAEVLFEPHSLSRNTPPCRVKGKGFTADAERSVGTASRPWDASGVNPTLNQANAGSGTIGASNQELFSQNFNGLVMNQNQVAATLDTHYGDKQGLEDQHVNAGCPNFILEKQEQKAVMCLNDQGGSVMQVEQGGNAGTLRANTHGNEQIVCYDARGNGNGDVSPTATGDHLNRVTDYTPIVKEQKGFYPNQFAHFKETAVAIAENIIGRQVQNGGNGTGAQEELAYTQNASGVMGVAQRVDVYNHTETGDIATTITANSGEPNTAGPKVMTSATVRRLLPIECERLMGFPDNWTRIPWKGKPEEECPDSPRYKACGNSFCVNVVRWIGLRIELLERRLNRDKN